jgi:hypothetical protein
MFFRRKESRMSKSGTWAAVAIALVAAGYLASTRAGHEWGDDFALYVSHARNLAEGRPYADTGYIYNPDYPSLSPRTYPPVLPLLLAPVWRLCGFDLFAMKVEIILLFAAFLAVFYLTFRAELPAPYLLAVLLLLSLNPYLWDYKDRIMSEIPFLLFTFLVFRLLTWAHDETRSPRGRRLAALGAGIALYLACGTRTIGIVLLPCVLAEGWLRRYRPLTPNPSPPRGEGSKRSPNPSPLGGEGRRGRPVRVTLLVLAAFAAGEAAQRLLLPFDGSYLEQLVLDPGLFGRNALWLVKSVGLYADNGSSIVGLVLSFAAVGGLGLVGFLHRARQGITCREVFTVVYLAAILVWPSADSSPRLVFPLAPLGLVYVCHGLRRLGAWRGAAWERLPGAVAVVGVLALYAWQYTRADFGSLHHGIGKAESVALIDYVRRQTPPDAVILFQKPRAMALLTGRRSSALHMPRDDEEAWHYLRRIGATYVVADRDLFGRGPSVVRTVARRWPDRLREVYKNQDFTVYAVVEPPPALRAAR